MSKFLKATIAATLLATPAMAEKLGLGRAATPDEIAAWDLDVSPDGTGLPVGSGDVFTGEELFIEQCAACHGDFAEGRDNWPKLAGGDGSLADEDPLKTVGSYWPYLSTAWDYVHRSMPYGNAQTLSVDETYAIVAYILFSNFIVDDDFVLSNENFMDVEMPNAGGFIVDDRAETEYPIFSQAPCMENCKDTVEVTKRAAVLDVTPTDEVEKTTPVPDPESAEAAEKPAPVVEEAAPAVAAIDPELVKKGSKVFKKCKACHQVGEGAKHRTGPILNGIVGQPAAAADGFKYSSAMRTAAQDGMVWDEETLGAFLAAPRKYLKGTTMGFAGLRKDADIQAVIAYIQSEGGQ